MAEAHINGEFGCRSALITDSSAQILPQLIEDFIIDTGASHTSLIGLKNLNFKTTYFEISPENTPELNNLLQKFNSQNKFSRLVDFGLAGGLTSSNKLIYFNPPLYINIGKEILIPITSFVCPIKGPSRNYMGQLINKLPKTFLLGRDFTNQLTVKIHPIDSLGKSRMTLNNDSRASNDSIDEHINLYVQNLKSYTNLEIKYKFMVMKCNFNFYAVKTNFRKSLWVNLDVEDEVNSQDYIQIINIKCLNLKIIYSIEENIDEVTQFNLDGCVLYNTEHNTYTHIYLCQIMNDHMYELIYDFDYTGCLISNYILFLGE